MIQREVFDWGIQLTAHPFTSSPLDSLLIRSEITLPRPGRGSVVKITFPGAAIVTPLNLVEAQTWDSAFQAVIRETKDVIDEMKVGNKKPVKPTRKPGKRNS